MEFKNFGKYTILKKLASGGMADIFLSINLSPTGFGRFVVIKRALSRFCNNPEFKDMFKNEARVVCNLKHKNIIPIYEFGIEKEQLFLVMEYIVGSSVRELTKRLKAKGQKLSLPNVVYIIKEVAAGLNYAHNAIDHNSGLPLNIIHRDVSPQNIMLSFDGEIKLIDFGIAKISDVNLTKAGHLKGKFSYMSPEQAEGKPLDPRTDIFCLGIILWELLTGKRLFASSNELASLKKARNCDIPDAQKINPDIPTELNNILKKSLEKNKNMRFKTAAHFEQKLNFFLNKNYPEFSQYDFITFMKTIYRKKIMTERENLKTYSSEFKKYINSLNLEKSFKNSLVLDIPDIGKSQKKLITRSMATQTAPVDDKGSLTGQSLFSQDIRKDLSLVSRGDTGGIPEDQSTIVRSRYDTTKKLSLSGAIKGEETLGPPTKDESSVFKADETVKAPEEKPQLKLVQAGNSTMSSQFTKSRMSLYSQESFLEDEQSPPSFINKFLGFVMLCLVLALLFSGLYYFVGSKNSLGPINFLSFLGSSQKKPDSAESSLSEQKDLAQDIDQQGTIQEEGPELTREPVSVVPPKNVRAFLITSRPSNAEIYINGSPISKYTPVLLELNWDRVKNITLKKTGYASKTVSIDPNQSQSKIEVFLTKTLTGKESPHVEIININ